MCACKGKELYCPEAGAHVKLNLLEKSEEELGALLENNLARAVITTKRKQNPIIFCSDKCKDKYVGQVVCVSCGNTDATIKPFPNIDAVLQLSRCVERCGAREDPLSSCADWQLKDTCKSCGSAMMPRKLDLAPAPTSLRATYCRAYHCKTCMSKWRS